MTRARKHIVCLSETPYYHVTSRCVRRAFLCGEDVVSGKSFEHRRGWVESRMRLLASIFSIDIAAYAVMSNHYHLVVKLSPSVSRSWSDQEVLQRWTCLFRGPLLVQRHFSGEPMSAIERATLASIAAVYRNRLGSLSWFMKCLNEPIARRANREDDCRGHFWEARFHSQPLTSERALLAAMAYVDLNPVRSGMAKTPETSRFTSFTARLHAKATQTALRTAISAMLEGRENQFVPDVQPLLPFADECQPANVLITALPVERQPYLTLVDVTGKAVVHGKGFWIEPSLIPVLERLQFDTAGWMTASTQFRGWSRRGGAGPRKTG